MEGARNSKLDLDVTAAAISAALLPEKQFSRLNSVTSVFSVVSICSRGEDK